MTRLLGALALVLVACGGEAELAPSNNASEPVELDDPAWAVECSYLARTTLTREGVLLTGRAEVFADGWASATFELEVVGPTELRGAESVADGGPRSAAVEGAGPVLRADFEDVSTLGTVTLSLDFEAEAFDVALNGSVFATIQFPACVGGQESRRPNG